jgi:hypothetical protein
LASLLDLGVAKSSVTKHRRRSDPSAACLLFNRVVTRQGSNTSKHSREDQAKSWSVNRQDIRAGSKQEGYRNQAEDQEQTRSKQAGIYMGKRLEMFAAAKQDFAVSE